MKPLALNLSQMKKIASDSKSSTFLHPSGHKMVIAHAPLSALHRKQIESLPMHKFAEGGDAQDEKEVQEETDFDLEAKELHKTDEPAQSPEPKQQLIARKYASGDEVIPINTQAQMPSPEQLQANAENMQQRQIDQQQTASDAAPFGTGDTAYGSPQPLTSDQNVPTTGVSGDFGPTQSEASNAPAPAPNAGTSPESKNIGSPSPAAKGPQDFEQGFQGKIGAIGEQQKIDAAKSKSIADAQQKALEDTDSLNRGFQANYRKFLQDDETFRNDYSKNHINSNHYLENMGTGEKVTTAIGLLLGGFSSAFTHQGNPAMDFLNKQIDRDISAQQSRIDQQKTLLGANRERFHDQVMQVNQTHINMNDMLAHKIQLAAAQQGTAQAKQNADAATSQLMMESDAYRRQNAQRATALQGLQTGTGTPEQLIPFLVPQEHQKEALKEIAQARSAATNHQFLMDQFDKAVKENTLIRTVGGIRTPASIIAMNALELPMIHDQEGRVNEYEQKTLQDLHPAGGDLSAKSAQKRIAYDQFIRNKQETPTLNAYAPGLAARIKGDQFQTNPHEGKTASDSKGNKIVMKDGRWVPYGG